MTGAFLLVLSTFTTVVEIRVLTTSDLAGQDTRISGGELHGIALIMVAVVALVMLAGALRGVRPAMMGLAATGLLASAWSSASTSPSSTTRAPSRCSTRT